MRILLLGRGLAAAKAFSSRMRSIVGVVAATGDPLAEVAHDTGVRVYTAEEAADLSNIDAAISFLYPHRIKPPLLTLPKIGFFNLHPAPLPELRGRGGYNFALLEGWTEYGASLHWMNEALDTGDLVDVRRFPILPDDTAHSLALRTHVELLEMHMDLVDRLRLGCKIPRTPQDLSVGRTYRTADMLAASQVNTGDPPDLTARRVRAFWYPPHMGAWVNIEDRHYTLVDPTILSKIAGGHHG